MNREALEKLLQEMKQAPKYSLHDLFRIRDAINILARYDLHDKDLLYEVNKFIEQEAQYGEDVGRTDYQPKHPDSK